ncbi:MAG: MotA/TolQ/ExbB proton channel family protein [Sandaracinaceae bacterium]|nr:MotA/TolQ/ExbB proton channel family protein [Sandaracinaceae bacterium]MDW8246390.1 MotA/TolQ/ExbB proton channel family protein [Sandaracinaceae bacterium]
MATLAHHFEEGGWGMYPILFFQILAIGIIVERAIYLYRASINRDVFLATMQKCILSGDIGRAIKLCSAANAPLARIVKAGLMKVHRPDAEVQAAMDEAALRELPLIEHRTPYLALLANLAMLSGLFGTVTGLIQAFGAVANADAASRATLLARGISEAMNCTAFGLLAAIIALIGFALLNGKTQHLLDDINAATVQVMNLVVSNRSKINLQGVPQAA